MTDDIVERLRKPPSGLGLTIVPASIFKEAADEIERLRASVDQLERGASVNTFSIKMNRAMRQK